MYKTPVFLLLLVISFFITFRASAHSVIKTTFYISDQLYKDTTYRIINAPQNTYGYEIIIKGKPFIRQQTIPGMPGILGFKRKADADKVAKLILKKLSKGMMPPTVEKHELDKLKIQY